MDRILQNTNSTIFGVFYQDGTAVDPSPATATITLTRADGTVLVNAAAATRTGTGTFAFSMTTAHTGLLDTLTAQWTSALGTVRTVVEIVGGFLCSIADLRTVFTDTTAYPGTRLEQIRTDVEQRLEKLLGYATVPRYTLESTRSHDGIYHLKPHLRQLRSLTVSGQAYTTDQLAGLRLNTLTGTVYAWPTSPWAAGATVVGYEHGLDYPDADISRAAVLAATELYSTASSVDARVVSKTADNASITYRAPGPGDVFANSELNAILAGNRLAGIA